MTDSKITFYPVAAFEDNYLWLFHRTGSTRAYVVDPGDAKPVLQALQDKGLTLAGILVTHHHWDHTGGIDELLEHNQVPVYGPSSDHIPQVTRQLRQGDRLALEEGLQFQVLEVPGHTLDHIAYFAEPDTQAPILLSGDTLFAGGCGRLFEGTPAQMHESLSKLAQLPENTAVYCTHEYTLGNLAFAAAVEPDNQALTERRQRESDKRQQQCPTLPSTIGLELQTNPFMRCHLEPVKKAAERHSGQQQKSAAAVLASIRQWKDNF